MNIKARMSNSATCSTHERYRITGFEPVMRSSQAGGLLPKYTVQAGSLLPSIRGALFTGWEPVTQVHCKGWKPVTQHLWCALHRLGACYPSTLQRLEACDPRTLQRLEACDPRTLQKLEACDPGTGELRHWTMSITRSTLSLAALACAAMLSAQTFDLDQFDQLFRPRLRLESRWLPRTDVIREPGTYEDRSASAVLTFPIHSTFNVGAQLDLTAGSLQELIKNGIRARASQVMGTLRYGAREVRFDPQLGGPRMLHTATAGALGVSLTKRYRILFWSLNVNVSEEDRTMDRAVPRFGGLIGSMRVKGLRRQFFYGLAIAYSDKLPIPIPFLGGSAPMGPRWSFNYVLPLQFSFTDRIGSRTRLDLGAGLDGSRTGIALLNERYNMNWSGVRGFLSVRHRLGAHLALRLEGGYMFAHRVSFGTPGGDRADPPYALRPGPSITAGVNVLFGKSVLQRVMDEVLDRALP